MFYVDVEVVRSRHFSIGSVLFFLFQQDLVAIVKMRGVDFEKLDVGADALYKLSPQGVVDIASKALAIQLVVKIASHFPLNLKLCVVGSPHELGNLRIPF